MSRLQKKCFMASAGMHLLLAIILLVGSAFMERAPKPEEIQFIDFTPTVLTDNNTAGGGNPKADRPAANRSAPPAPPAPAPAPAPMRQREPARTVEPKVARHESNPVHEEKRNEESFEPRKPRLPKVSTRLVTRRSSKTARSTARADDTAAEERRAAMAARRAMAAELARAADSVADAGSAATPIVIGDHGPGGGGPSYAGLNSLIQKVYMDAWVPPTDSAKESAVARARIVIARDGSVVDFELVSRSGDTLVDASVQKTLERVHTIGRAFPDSIKDKQRSYILVFDLKAKRGMA